MPANFQGTKLPGRMKLVAPAMKLDFGEAGRVSRSFKPSA